MTRMTKNQLRELRLFNPHAIAQTAAAGNIDINGDGIYGVFVGHTPADRGRGGHPAVWRVYRIGFKTHPDGPWYDYGNKTFIVGHASHKEAMLAGAKAWAEARYGITAWERSVFGSWHPAGAMERAVANARAVGARAEEGDK